MRAEGEGPGGLSVTPAFRTQEGHPEDVLACSRGPERPPLGQHPTSWMAKPGMEPLTVPQRGSP